MVAIFSLSGGEAGPLGGTVGDDTPETPEFAFEASKPKAVETSAKANHQGRRGCAAPSEGRHAAARRSTQWLFLDPGNWMDGEYDDVLSFFSDGARDAAEAQLEVLTAGPEAGDAFETISRCRARSKSMCSSIRRVFPTPSRGVRFFARGTGADGQVEMISNGQFVFEKVRRVARGLVLGAAQRREREPKPSASARRVRAAAPSRRRPRHREAPRDVPRGRPGRLGLGSSLGAVSGTVEPNSDRRRDGQGARRVHTVAHRVQAGRDPRVGSGARRART